MSDEERSVTNTQIINALKHAQEVNRELEAIVESMQPAYSFGLMAMQDTNSYTMKEAADLLSKKKELGRTNLFKWLRLEEILLSSGTYWNQPPREYIERGYFTKAEKATPVGMKPVTLVTNKGIEFIMRRWDERSTA